MLTPKIANYCDSISDWELGLDSLDEMEWMGLYRESSLVPGSRNALGSPANSANTRRNFVINNNNEYKSVRHKYW